MSILKKIQKLLRRYRGLLAVGIILLVIAALFSLGFSYMVVVTGDLFKSDVKQEEAIDVLSKQPIRLVLKTHYICGMQTEIKEFNNVKEMDQWVRSQPTGWGLESKSDEEVIMRREVLTDLSPLCKNEGYFGLSTEGVLTLFQGPPGDNKVIQTFFRIDTGRLESKIPDEEIGSLRRGIRIHTVDEYWSVLSTYGEFATEF